MKEKTPLVNVELEFTPLGDLIVCWNIPIELIQENTEYKLLVPGFKYDLPRFLSVPVPFSSKVSKLDITYDINMCDGISEIRLQDAKYSDKELVIVIDQLKNKQIETIDLRYVIKGLMNADGIFFVAVYPFRSFIQNINHSIIVNAKFSYNLKNYKFWERNFHYPSGKKHKEKNRFKVECFGDELKGKGELMTKEDTVLDIHITGTRLPFFIRRDYFWLMIFALTMLVFLSPFISELLNLFKTK